MIENREEFIHEVILDVLERNSRSQNDFFFLEDKDYDKVADDLVKELVDLKLIELV